jgi:periplasmic divalent cation tolerance protein
VLTTTDSPELANRIATALVDAGEAACVTIVPGVRSVYRWEGKVCNEGELLLLIKTVAAQCAAITSRIRQLHSYEVPEVLALPIATGSPDYLHWLKEQVRPTKGE